MVHAAPVGFAGVRADGEVEGRDVLGAGVGQRGVAAAPVGGDLTVAPQPVQRLSYGFPADAEPVGQLAFPRQSFPGWDDPVAQLAEQLCGDPRVQRFVVGRMGGAGHVRAS